MELQTETLDGGIFKVTLDGRMDIAGAQKVDLQFAVISGSQTAVIVDLEKVAFMASMGLRTLIMTAKKVKSRGGKMVLLNPTAGVAKVLEDTGTSTFIPVVQDLASAIAGVQA